MYIVTGGAGFIGSAFVKKLNDEGIDDILIVDNLGSSEKWKNLLGKQFNDYVHKNDFLEMVSSERLHEKVDAVIHLGACSSTLERDAEYIMKNNYHYSCVLSRWAMKRDVRFIYASSAATYGDGALGFSDKDESTLQLHPLNIYGYSKHLFDLWALRNSLTDKMVGIKFFNVFGPNEYHKGEMRSVVVKAFEQIRDTGALGLFKSYNKDYAHGEQKRDFVYIKDCNDILWWLLQNPSVNGIFNLGTGTARTWKDLASAIFSAMGKKTRIKYIEMPKGLREKYQYFTEADMTKLKASECPLSFRSLEDAVADYVKNYLRKDFAIL